MRGGFENSFATTKRKRPQGLITGRPWPPGPYAGTGLIRRAIEAPPDRGVEGARIQAKNHHAEDLSKQTEPSRDRYTGSETR